MTAAQLRAWRKRLRYTQQEAADAIGISLRSYVYCEAAERPIGKTMALACAAIALGIAEYPQAA